MRLVSTSKQDIFSVIEQKTKFGYNVRMDNFSPLKTDIDPVFKGNPVGQKPPVDTENSPLVTGVYGVLNNQNYIPDQVASNLVANPNIVPKTLPKGSIRTYKDDIQSAIQASHLSSVNIAVAENEKMHSKLRTDLEKEADSEYSKNKIIILAAISLIIIGIIAVTMTYLIKNQGTTVVVQTQTPSSLITTEYKDELSVNSVVKNRFVSALSSRLNDIQIPINNTYNVYITTGTSTAKRLLTANEFISLTGLNMPDMITRTLTPDFMVGMYSFSQNLPFVIFKTSSFENTYAGMISWEKDLERDFSLMFRLNGVNGGGGLADALTPTPTDKFADGVVVNQDVRLIKNSDGKTIFLYAILNKDTIVITVNEDAFKEIVTRLNKEKGLKR
jgi:hypothetical protein